MQARLDNQLNYKERSHERRFARKTDRTLAQHLVNTERKDTFQCYREVMGSENRTANERRLCTP